MYRLRLFVLLTSFFVLCSGCNVKSTQKEPSVLERVSSQFPQIQLPDTLFLGSEVAKENENLLAIEDLMELIGEEMLSEYNSNYDSAMTDFLGISRFDINEDVEAFYMAQRDSWVVHNSLFLYSKSQQKFFKNCLVSAIDGGDGGQQLIDSWILDEDQDGKKDLVTRIHDQWITPDPDQDEMVEHASDTSVVDLDFAGKSSLKGLDQLPAFMARYPINW